jgi:6-pyruvoyl-tetrahydropterin synthase
MFNLTCAKENFKFSAAHFVAHGGTREKLHGHNYRLSVSLRGASLGADGCVMDFGELKTAVRALCACVPPPLPPFHPPATHTRLPLPCAASRAKCPEPPTALARLRRELDEKFLCPMASPTVAVTVTAAQVELRVAHDGTFFSLPRGDVLCLPLTNSTVEELAVYLTNRLVAALGRDRLLERGVRSVAVSVAETPGQDASYEMVVDA